MVGRELINGAVSRGWRRMALKGALVATVAAGLAVPGLAVAHKKASSKSVKLHAGTVTLKFTPAVYAALTQNTTGAFADTRTVSPVAPGASAASGIFTFPLTSGKVNVKKLTGKVASSGGINFQFMSTLPLLGSSTSQFELTSFALHFGAPLPELTTTFVGGSTSPGAPLASLSTAGVKHSKHGHSVTISGVTLKLTSAGVQILDGQAKGFTVGEVIGTASVSATT
jgi:hypothetical protein